VIVVLIINKEFPSTQLFRSLYYYSLFFNVSVVRPSSSGHASLKINTTDNESVVSRMLANLVDNADRFRINRH
jgi:hypothetical protein